MLSLFLSWSFMGCNILRWKLALGQTSCPEGDLVGSACTRSPGRRQARGEFLPVVQVSAGEGNTMATGPASITFSPTISQITRFPRSVPVPCCPGPSPTAAVSPVLSRF